MPRWTLTAALLLLSCGNDGGDSDLFEICDDDNDGFVEVECKSADPSLPSDCDDELSTVYPGADEVCDGIDNNCDGVIDEGNVPVFADADGDGFGDPNAPGTQCGPIAGWVTAGTDCNDENKAISPDGTESCNAADDNCDGVIDESGSNGTPFFRDSDGDNYGDAADTVSACFAPSGYVVSDDDCDDNAPSVYPDADERCDGVDNDCDLAVDDEDDDMVTDTIWYADADGDAHGDPLDTTVGCDPGEGWAAVGDDCDDNNAAIVPGAIETCNLIDDDCDGETDDGVTTPFYKDADNDGVGTSATVQQACSAPIGFVAGLGDCDDSHQATYPSAPEVCDLKDNDCDSLVDEGATNPGTYYKDADSDTYGDAKTTTQACGAPAGYVSNSTDCNDTTNTVNPGKTEICNNGIDENCDTFGCEPRGTVSLTQAKYVIKGEGPEDRAGSAFTGGDLDADAARDDDIVVGAEGTEGWSYVTPNGEKYAPGAVYGVTLPSNNTLLSQVSGRVSQDSEAAHIGGAVGACDINRDGKKDVIVSTTTPGAIVDNDDGWRIRIYHSTITSTRSFSNASTTVTYSGYTDARYGDSSVLCGDISGDSLDDLILGAPNGGLNETGQVWVMQGKSAGYPSTFDLGSATSDHETINGATKDDQLGSSVAVGDVNGDGKDDVVAGAPGVDTPSSNAGTFYIYFGPFDGDRSVSQANATYRGENSKDALGTSLAAGDLNCDGKDDIVATAGGDLYVVMGKTTGWSTASISTATEIRRNTSGKVAVVGDLNGDGCDELVVTSGSTAQLWYGRATLGLAARSADTTVTVSTSAIVHRVGDVNADGFDDLFVGDPDDDTTGTNAGILYGFLGGDK